MPGTFYRFHSDLRELRFVLMEQFRLGELLGHGVFEDWGEEEAVRVLREAYRYAKEIASPLNAAGDRAGCRVATRFAAWAAATQTGRTLLVANQFSQALSEVCVGWLLLDAALISERMLEKLPPSDPGCDFYRGKTSSAEYFVHWCVATVPAKMRVLGEAPAVALAMTGAAFGGDMSGD